jgi:colanic acid/amylovoran biosynthesis glycosyltransferase
MKVSYILMLFPVPSETFASNDIKFLREAGVEVSVHSLRPAPRRIAPLVKERNLIDISLTYGGYFEILKGLGVAVSRPLVLFHLLGYIWRTTHKKPEHLLKSLVLMPRIMGLFSRLEKESPDVIHLYWGHYPSLVGYLVQSYLPHIVLSISLSSYDLQMEYGGSGPVARRADMVCTHAKVDVESINRAFGIPAEQVNVIYNGIDLGHIENLTGGLNKIRRRIVTVGRLVSLKAMGDVLTVFAKVLPRWPEASLVILGDGPELERLKDQARDLKIDHAVDFRGHVTHDEVFIEMAKAELLLFMSRTERLPNVVKEAIACRCICVVTKTPGLDELLVHCEHGYVMEQGAYEDAAGYINSVFEDGSAVRNMTESAYRHLTGNFNITHTIAQYVEKWRDLISEKQKRINLPDRFD